MSDQPAKPQPEDLGDLFAQVLQKSESLFEKAILFFHWLWRGLLLPAEIFFRSHFGERRIHPVIWIFGLFTVSSTTFCLQETRGGGGGGGGAFWFLVCLWAASGGLLVAESARVSWRNSHGILINSRFSGVPRWMPLDALAGQWLIPASCFASSVALLAVSFVIDPSGGAVGVTGAASYFGLVGTALFIETAVQRFVQWQEVLDLQDGMTDMGEFITAHNTRFKQKPPTTQRRALKRVAALRANNAASLAAIREAVRFNPQQQNPDPFDESQPTTR